MEKKENMRLLWEINKNLEEISSKIDKLVSMYEFTQKHELENFREKILGRSKIRREIYGLCDGTKTVQEIAARTGKTMPHVSRMLTELEKAKLIKAKELGRKKYYIRVV